MRKHSTLGKWGGLLSSEPNDEECDATGDCAKTENQKFMMIYQQVIKSGIKTISLSV